jgi:hypothetical protein
VVLRTAGLGNARLEQISVELGDSMIRPAAVHPAANEPGLDEIEFTIPGTFRMNGCYVPLRVRAAGSESNLTSLPVVQGSGYCPHRLGLTNAQMETLDAGGMIPAGVLEIHKARFGSSESFEYLETAYTNSGYVRRDRIADLAGIDSILRSGCKISANPRVARGPWFESLSSLIPDLDLGARIELLGPDGQMSILPTYSFNPVPTSLGGFSSLYVPQQYAPGVWQVTSEGSDIVLPFLWRFRIPPYWEPENIEVLSALRSGSDQKLRWDGAAFEEGEVVTLTLAGTGLYQLECTASATSGSMQVSTTDYQRAFADQAPGSFEAMVVLTVDREPGSPSLFPLELRNGERGIGLFNGRFGVTNWIKVSVQ